MWGVESKASQSANKPGGMTTSRDVVNIIAAAERGEGGPCRYLLDPLASGVLVVCLGKATRLIELRPPADARKPYPGDRPPRGV